MSDLLARARLWFDRLRAWIAGLSRPARILVFTTLAASVALALWLGTRAAWEPYAPLYTQLEREDAAAVVTKLKELKVPYKLVEGGSTIEVPEGRVHETRLELATAGLPRGGAVGFESFDKMKLGATEFEQRVLFRRALEGELSRTIGTIGAVQSARVHLVLPEKSVFVARGEAASASVVVKLHPGRTLGPQEIAGVVHLVAASVPSLAPERVALVTTDGVMLHKPRKPSDDPNAANTLDPDVASQTQALQAALEDRVRQMLERMVGPGHADVRVSADVDLARSEHVEDHYDKDKSVLRSEDMTVERTTTTESVAGVPGAESNVPAGAATGAQGTLGPGVVRESHTRNFEIDHVTDKRVQAGGGVRRLTVAVVLDGVHPGNDPNKVVPRSAEEIAKVQGLVASAVGADLKRGDVVTVESMPFVAGDPLVDAAPAPANGPIPEAWRKRLPYIGAGVGALLVLATVLALRRGAKKKKAEAARKVEDAIAGVLEEAPGAPELTGEETVASLPADPRAAALALAGRDPATAALVLRAWLGAESAQGANAA